MSHGIIHNTKHGLVHGTKHGGAAVLGSMSGVTRDATSGIYAPANAAEWTQTMTSAGISSGGPSLLWLCQEASGNLADSIGGFTGTAGGTAATYQNAVAGWARKAINTTDGATTAFSNTAAGLPDPISGSMLSIVYGLLSGVVAGTRAMYGFGVATRMETRFTTTPRTRVQAGAASATGAVDPSGAVRPYVISHNFTSSSQSGYTTQEVLSPVFTALSGKSVNIGNGGALTPPMGYLYKATFFNAAAELTLAQVRSLLQALGWTIPW